MKGATARGHHGATAGGWWQYKINVLSIRAATQQRQPRRKVEGGAASFARDGGGR